MAEYGVSSGPGGASGPTFVEVVVEPEIRIGAGQVVIVPVLVRHWLPDPVMLTVSVLGLDANWSPAPTVIGPITAGTTTQIELSLNAEQGALAARYPFVIAVASTSVGGTRNKNPAAGSAQVGLAEAVLVLDSPDRIALTIEPQQPAAVFTKKIQVSLTNPGREDRQFTLIGRAATGARVTLDQADVRLPAGRTVVVKGRLWVSKPSMFGSENSHAFSISGRGNGASQHVEGILRARPLLRGWLTATLAVILTVALWVGVALVVIPRINDRVAGQDALSAARSQLAQSSSESAQSAQASGTEGAGAAGGGADTAGGAAGGPVGPSAANPTDGARLAGTMLGADPAGVTVLVEPASVVQANQVGAQAAPGLWNPGRASGLRSDGPVGKIFAAALRQVAPQEPVGQRSTTSAADGAWSFAGITGPGYYLVTFARPGFQTQRYIIDPALLAGADPMKVELSAGQGKLSGVANAAGGPVGAATVTITDGTNSLETSTVSTGTQGQGSWEVNGLSTPGTFLVTVAADGYGTTSALVVLGAGAEEVVDLTLTPGVGSITGLVSGMDQFGVLGGLGGLTVTAVDGELTRTANTVTAGAVGRFSLPDLPTPGNYTLTVSGVGYQPKTQQISLAQGAENASVDLTMTRSDGVVTGSVTDEGLVGLAGVGLTLTGQDASFKTMTASAPPGSFRFSGVTPGLYVLAASQYGRQTSYATVEITAAETATADLVLAVLSEGELAKDSRIRGRAVDARTGGPLTCDRAAEPNPDCRVTVSTVVDMLDGTGPRQIVSRAGAGDDYNLPALDDTANPGLLPGLYALTVSAPGYEPVTINIQVAMSAIVPAPQVSLQPLGLINGTITAKEGSPNAPTCVVAVPSGAAVPTSCVITPAVNLDSVPTCVADGARCAVTVKGAYEMRGFSAGGYDLSAIPTDPEYLNSAALPLQMDRGAAIRYEPVLNRKPRLQITVLYPDDITGTLTPVVGVGISLTDSTGAAVGVPSGGALTNGDGNILLTQLAEGIYTAAATIPAVSSPVGRTLTGSVVAAAITVNQTGSATVVITGVLGPVVGRLQTTVDGQPQPLGGASVTITGITGYSGRTPVTAAVTLTTDAQGCYAVLPTGWTDPVTSVLSDCPSDISGAARGSATSGLITRTVAVGIAEKPANTFPYQASGVLINPPVAPSVSWTLDPITLAAQPSEFGVHKLVFNGPPITGASVTVTTRAIGSGNVAVTVDADGTLHWQDDQIIKADQVVPGRYKIRVQALGYSPLLFDLFCALGQTCVTTEAGQTAPSAGVLVMRKLGTVAGSVTVPASSDVAVNFQDAVVSVISAPSGVGAITVKVYPSADPRLGVIEFRDSTFSALDPVTNTADPTPVVGAGLAVSGRYTFQVRVSGFDSYPVTVDCTAGTIIAGVVSNGSCSVFAAPLTQLPTGAGTVDIAPTLDSAALATTLPRVSLIVTKQAVATSVITATVNADGTISWQDSSLPAGLLQGGNYTVTATLPGYRSTATEYSFVCSAASCTPGVITLRELPRPSAVIEVGSPLPGSTTDPAWAGLVTTVVARPGTAGGVTVSAAGIPGTAQANLIWTDSQQPYAGVVPPGEYILSFGLPGYEPSVRYRFACSGSTSGCVMSLAADPTASPTPITPQVITLTRFPGLGTITWDLDGDTTGLLPAIQVTGAPTGTASITVTPNADPEKSINWLEAGNPPGVVRVGTYQLTVSATGYETQTFTLVCTAAGCPTIPLVLKLTKPGGLTLNFVNPAGDPVTGATVTLSGTDVASNTVTLASSESQVTFNNISARNPNSYKVKVQAAGFKFDEFGYQSAAVQCVGVVPAGLVIKSGGTICTVTVSPLGVVAGGVIGLTPSTLPGAPPSEEPLAQVLMTATQVNSVGTVIAGTTPFVQRSDADGSYRITGTGQKEGLANNGTFFKISADRAGYQKAEATVAFDANGVLSVVGGAAGFTLDGDRLTIRMTVNPVDLQVQLRLGTTNVTDGVTLSLLAGTTVIATCPPGGATCAVPVTGTSTYFTFLGVTPGVYTLQVVSSNSAYRSLNTQVIVYAGQAIQFAPISLATGSSVVSGQVTIGPDEAPLGGQSVKLVTEANPNVAAKTTTTDAIDGTYSFDTVLDGRYQILIQLPGYDDWRSPVFTVNSGGDPNVQVAPARLSRATRTVAITVTSRADPVAILTGATVSLAPTAATGPLAGELPRTPVQVNGNVATFTGVPTGNWTAVVTTLAAPRSFSAGLFSTTVQVDPLAAGAAVTSATGAIQILDTAKKVGVSWALNSCATAPTSLSAVLTRTSTPGGSTPPLSLTIAGTTAESGTIYLPDGSYSAQISHVGTSGWSSVTDAFNLPAVVPGDSDVPLIQWAAVPVPVTVTLNGVNASATTVLAHKSGVPIANTNDDVTVALSGAAGQLCLEPDVAWDISVPAVGSTSYLGSTKTVTPTRATPGNYVYAGFALAPEVTLQTVAGRAGDARTVALQLFAGSPATGSALFSQSLTFAANETSQILPAGTTVYVAAGSYTWTAVPDAADAFGPFSAGAVVTTSSVQTTLELPYARVVAQVAVTRDVGTPAVATPQAGANVTIKLGATTIYSGPTVAGGSTAVIYDLPPGAYVVEAIWTSPTPAVTYTGTVTPAPAPVAGPTIQTFTIPIVPVA